jgi:uncharacterized protein YjdB
MLAAIHYRETNFSHTNPSNGQGIFQFVNGEGGPYPAGAVSDKEFIRQLTFMAKKIQSDYVYRGSLNYTHRALKANEPDSFRVQDTLFSYNGRATVYAKQAATYGFSSTLSPYEGSPYVMNMFDCPRLSMGIITTDYGSLNGKDGRLGAFTLYARLKGDSYWKSLPDWLGTSPTQKTIISSSAHIQGTGWSKNVVNSGIIGTTGESRALEAFMITGSVQYSSYSDATGWQSDVNRGMSSGTTTLNRPIQAIKISSFGSLASTYDLYYRVHVSNVGWMEWTKNGAPAGVTGKAISKHIEAVELQLVPKGWPSPALNGVAFIDYNTTTNYAPQIDITAKAHVGSVGWQPTVSNDMILGTVGQSKQIEAISATLTNNTGLSGEITYSAHVANIGWQPFVRSGATAGTTGKGFRMEAVRLSLTSELVSKYDIWYRAHVGGKGWLGWAKNGDPAGSAGSSLQLEAIEVHITPKDTGAFTASRNAYYNPSAVKTPYPLTLSYSVHASRIGWLSGIGDSGIGGTTGQSRPLEALRFDSLTYAFGSSKLSCSVYVRGSGWTTPVNNPSTCGTTGQGKAIESVKLGISGDIANTYSILYKTHISNKGWTDWSENLEASGKPGSGNAIEAVVIHIAPKN